MAQRAVDKGSFTYGHYRTWPEEERWELIDGQAIAMSPAPSAQHQLVLGELHRQIANQLLNHQCQVFLAPFDVLLSQHPRQPNDEINTVVQPDITVVCDPEKIIPIGCKGPPDWVIEIISPSTAPHDQIAKFSLYERAGIEEYWLVHPIDGVTTVYTLEKSGKYGRPNVFDRAATLESQAVEGVCLELSRVFANISELAAR